MLDGENLETLWRAYDIQTQAANDACDAARKWAETNEALKALTIDYATFAGEMSKALPHDDPTWMEMYELGRRLREIVMGPNAIAQGREPGLSGEASLGATGYTAGEKDATP